MLPTSSPQSLQLHLQKSALISYLPQNLHFSTSIRAMAKLSLVKVVCVAVLCMVVVAPHAEATISCGTVVSALSPCVNYLKGSGPLPQGCCGGVKALAGAAKTTPDRQAACGCLKSLAGRLTGLKPAIAAGLPGKCGVNVGYPISTSTDCTKVH